MKQIKIFLLILVLIPGVVFAQKTIKGNVKDADSKEPLIGVYIVLKDSTALGTVTDYNGDYSINVPKGFNILSFSYVGYQPVEINIDDKAVINVEMRQGKLLDEVVVIGYGTVKRKDVTGSLQTVTSDKFNKGAITSPQELMAGKISGVTVTTDGSPGGGSKIRIRGESSLSASNDPLIVIDGIPTESGGIAGSRNPLNIINPNDIESITVLKDASATAIYGNRASGGVIMITTKKGTLGQEMRISYNANVSMGSKENKVSVMDHDSYIDLIKTRFGEESTEYSLLGDANTDWQEEIFQNAIGQDHTLSLSGSYSIVPYRVSFGYSNKNGILKTDNFTRYTAGINLNPQFLDNSLQVNLSFKGMKTKNHFADRGAIGAALGFDPTQSVYDENSPYGGYTTWTDSKGRPRFIAPTNPLALLNLRDNNSDVYRYIAGSKIDYIFPFMPELRANLNLAYDYSEGKGTLTVPTYASFAFDTITGGGVNNKYDQIKKNSLLEFYLNYKKEIGIHNFDLMGGYSWQHFYNHNTYTNTDAAGTPAKTETGDDPGEYYLLSLFGRLNYSLYDKYILTLSVRRDGTSRFAPENRWGLFPAAALAIKVVENNNTFFNKMKLRLGWGITGQQEIGDYYAYLARYEFGDVNAQYQFGDNFINTLRPNGYDENIKWEETSTVNAGVDFSIIRERLSGSFDVYQRNTEDLLNYIPIPAGTNLTNFITTNIGAMESKGLELSINMTPVLKDNIQWDFSYNISYNKSEITKLTATQDSTYKGVLTGGIAGGVGSNIQIHSVGYEPYAFYVYKQKYDENGNILEGEFEDLNGDGIVNGDDKYRYKNPAPDYTMGFSSKIRIKDFDFSFAGRINIGNYVYNNVETDIGYINRLNTGGVLWNIHTSAVDLNVEDQGNLTFSDYFVKEASFLRFDHLTAGYNFDNLLGKFMRIYATVQNPFYFTKYDGLDPELGNGIDNNVYPRPRTYVLGVNVDF